MKRGNALVQNLPPSSFLNNYLYPFQWTMNGYHQTSIGLLVIISPCKAEFTSVDFHWVFLVTIRSFIKTVSVKRDTITFLHFLLTGAPSIELRRM